MKLLAKIPEERYQSAGGIQADLETCLTQLQSLGYIDPFPLTTQDISDRFVISEKLYGREAEITQLLTTFEGVSQGSSEIILVSGYSGIGKSALLMKFINRYYASEATLLGENLTSCSETFPMVRSL